MARRNTTAFVILCAAALAACSSPEENAAAAGGEALAAFEQGDLDQARARIRTALNHRDDVAEYWALLGRIELARNEHGLAFAAYSRAFELDQSNVEALNALAQISLAVRDFKQAERYSEQLALLNPQDPGAQLVQGFLDLEGGRAGEAAAAAEEILQQYPTSEAAVILKARALSASDRHGAAVQLLQRQISDRSPSRDLLLALIDVQKRAENPVGVGEAFEALAQLEPKDHALKLQYAEHLFVSSATQRALDVIKELPPSASDSSVKASQIVQTMLKAKRGTIRAADFKVLRNGATPNQRVAFAEIALHQAQPKEALELLAPFIRQEVRLSNLAAAGIHATALLMLGEDRKALSMAQKILELDPTNGRALRVRGTIAMTQGDTDQALRDAQALVRDQPRFSWDRILLAKVFEKRGQPKLALLTLRRALSDFPDNPAVVEEFARLLRKTGEPERAAQVTRDFVRAHQTSGEAVASN